MLIVSPCFVCEPPYEDNFNLRLLPTDLILICSRQLLTPPALTKTKSEANQAFSKSRRDRGENPLVSRSLETRKLKDWMEFFHSLQILSAILTLHYNRRVNWTDSVKIGFSRLNCLLFRNYLRCYKRVRLGAHK